jgi:branched-subunit amino acid transport protein
VLPPWVRQLLAWLAAAALAAMIVGMLLLAAIAGPSP